MSDNHKNFAYSTIATTPSPAISGTSLTIAAGNGSIFPTPPFNATIWPTSTNPLTSNAEIVRVTALSADTFTITRAQENSRARTIQVGDQIANTITVKTFTDIEAGTAPSFLTITDSATAVVLLDSSKVSQNATITLGGNRMLSLSGLAAGMTGVIIVKQDLSGNRTLTLPPSSNVVNDGAGTITLSTAASAIDILTWMYDGSNIFWNYGNLYS